MENVSKVFLDTFLNRCFLIGRCVISPCVISPLVHLKVSDDLAQLALLYNMNGEYEKALTVLHKRLVIHEKYGPGRTP
jgi:hypothetical protein